MTSLPSVPIRNDQGKICCHVRGDTLYKTIKNRHMLYNPPAICWQDSILKAARRLGATRCVVTNRETGVRYTADLDAFDLYGFRVDRHRGEQTGLKLDRWLKTYLPVRKSDTPAPIALAEPVREKPRDEQLSLGVV